MPKEETGNTGQVADAAAELNRLLDEVGRVVVGRRDILERLLAALLAGGHVLLEGVPGLGKTLLARSLCQALKASFSRVQFTPDLLPGDIIGHQAYLPRDGSFEVCKGPIFANLVLADEVNRAPAKVQSALLEAMQERQVTIGRETFQLPEPFMVLATQNPIELEGTYPLPEAELDRFMFKLLVDYPDAAEEGRILDAASGGGGRRCDPVMGVETVLSLRAMSRAVFVADPVKDYVVRLVRATRRPGEFGLGHFGAAIAYGASPRAGIAILDGARALALMRGRAHVLPDDVKEIAPDALRHRLVLSFEAQVHSLSAETIIREMLDAIPVVSGT
ncbi:MAG TPA: MoxR family ATPase [Candidatus Brocadiia bacterium]|nr:MoxR family ATPase [Candidatus Brocadiia bacterium]